MQSAGEELAEPPKQPPKFSTMIRLIAELDGFLGPTSNDEAGMKTIWLGLQRERDFADGLRFAHELQPTSPIWL